MKVTLYKILISLILVFFFSCNKNAKFNKVKWNIEGDLKSFPNRENMLSDLIENQNLTGLYFEQITQKIGVPENKTSEENKIFFIIKTEYGTDIDPTYIKNLEIEFGKNGLVKKLKKTETN